jgi:hypothetical protein
MTGFAEVLRWTALVMLSCVVPLGIFVGRNNIRAFRRELVRDLERLFSFASLPNARLGQPDGISPSRMAEMLGVDKAGPKVRC